MARIVFYPLAEVGHVNGTLKLAKQLRARGHDVRYMVLPDIEDYVRSLGWDVIPVFGELYPKGYFENVDRVMHSDAPDAQKRQAAREFFQRMTTYFPGVLFGPDFKAQLEESRADLLLADATFPLPALTARMLGMPAAIFSTTLPLRADAAVAPLVSPAPPPRTWWSRLKVRASWLPLSNGWMLFYGNLLRRLVKEVSQRSPEVGKLCHYRSHLQQGPYVELPTLIACCAEFDFPRASVENLHYIGPGVDLERADAPLPPEVEQDSRPLLYFSLGSLGHRVLPHRAFFQAVLDMVARRPDWRLLMVVGRSLDVASFRSPPNATLVQSAPQLSVLRRASVMLTHGGLNSVKECLCSGVPMLVFPTGFDQPGNGARVVHHGLGLMGDIRQATPETLSSMLDTVAGDPGYRARVRAMQERFLAADAANQGVELVERLIAERRPGATRQLRDTRSA
jgi:MGT family glycosyltransferase